MEEPSQDASEAAPETAARIGRFAVLDRLGSGGMGIVYSAFDADLDRRVALKVLRADRTDEGSRARLLREAQALAKVSHPNVVPIYEVGTHEGGVYIAMEFVRGRSPGDWVDVERPPWPEVLVRYLEAGRGLAAAHVVGIVHRDFKPDNVVLGHDGRVRVVDFGLARRASDDRIARTIETELPAPFEPALDSPLTHAGSVMGTPAYMAPEQFLGEETDARADQFAFCVALWEALYGERPFAGTTRLELIAAVTRGELRASPKRPGVPRWIHEAVVRGLNPRPTDRWPSMDPLLAELGRDPRARRRRWLAGGIVVVLAAGAVAGVKLARWRGAQQCAAEASAIDSLWNDVTRASVREKLLGTAFVYATDTVDRVIPAIDSYVAAWRSAREDACVATRVRDEQDEELLERRRACLDDASDALRARLDRFENEPDLSLRNSVASIARLPALERCADRAWLLANESIASEPATREAAEAVRAAMRDAWAARDISAHQRALEIARAALRSAEQLGEPRIIAEALVGVGVSEALLGIPEDAERHFADAYFAAVEAGADGVAANAALRRASITVAPHRLDEAEVWVRHARAITARQGGLDVLDEEFASEILGAVSLARGHLDEARAHIQAGVESRRRRAGELHPDAAESYDALARLAMAAGDHATACVEYARALGILEQTLGADHPANAFALNGLAACHYEQGHFAESVALMDRALPLIEREFGDSHPTVAQLISNSADALRGLGRHAEAIERYRRALPMLEQALGERNELVVYALIGLGDSLRATGAAAAAIEVLDRSERIARGEETRIAARCASRFALARALGDDGRDRARALALADQAAADCRAGPATAQMLREIESWTRAFRPGGP